MKKAKLVLPDNVGIETNQWEDLKRYDGKTMRVKRKVGHNHYEICPYSYEYPLFLVKLDCLEEIKQPEILTAKATRDEAVKLINEQLSCKADFRKAKNNRTHYGKQELMKLLDFIYGEDTECIEIKPFMIDKEQYRG